MSQKTAYTHESTSAITVEWYTPSWIFEALDMEFDTDPCHPAERIAWVPVKKTIALPTDGLAADWQGEVWLNPPYGKETPKWLEKMDRHRLGVALVFSRTDCKWFHDYVMRADALLFLKGRVQFVAGNSMTKNSGSTCGSVLVGWGHRAIAALRNAADEGAFIPLREPVDRSTYARDLV